MADDLAVLKKLEDSLNARRGPLERLNEYYEGEQRLRQLGLAIPEELKMFTVVLNWSRVAVDAVEQRLDLTGFQMPGTAAADTSLWDVWQYNNMDERAGLTHIDGLALGSAFACVGTNDEDRDAPLITVESPLEMVVERDSRTHRVVAAARFYDADETGSPERATLYLPDLTRWLVRRSGVWVNEFEPDAHGLGAVPVVPFVNRNRATRLRGSTLEGISEMRDVIPIADSASRAITNTQLLQETLVAPARGVLGATKGDFVDRDGNPLSAWETYFGSVWAMANKDAKTFQFDAADMKNIETIVNMYARLASGVTHLPVEYFGLTTNNPPSAEGYRAGETRLVKTAERKQIAFGNSWESVMRLVIRFRDGAWSEDARRMEAKWRDAGTPTLSMVADAASKEFAVGLVDWETAQEDRGRSPEMIRRMKERRDSDSAEALSFGVQRVAEVTDERTIVGGGAVSG